MALPLTIDDLPPSPAGPEPTADWPPRLTLVPPMSPSAVSPSTVSPSAVSRSAVSRSAIEPVAPRPALSRAVYHRRRLGVLITIGLFVAVGLNVMSAPSSGASRSPLPAAGTEAAAEYVVQPGDTLWSIAGDLAPDADRRAAVDQLAAVNAGVDLQVGQRLVVPVSF